MLSSFLFIISGQAYGWETKTNSNGDTLHWTTNEVHYALNAEGSHGLSNSDVETAIQNAAAAWSFGNLSFVFDGDTKKNSADYSDNVFSVYFSDNWTEDPEVMAITYTWSTSEGEIVHFDMEINSEHHDWSIDGSADKHDLQNAITHEFGHALGLDHSAQEQATMAPTALPGEISKRDLEQDDIDGYQNLYKDLQGTTQNNTTTNDQANNSGGGFTEEAASGSNKNQKLQNGTYSVPLQTTGCSSSNASVGWFGLLFGVLLSWRRRSL